MSAVYNSTVQGFYLSYYGRPADPAGLTFWTGQLAAAGGNLSSILNAFGTSAEATRRYGTGTDASKIEAIYQQTFGRAADPVGLAFYQGELTAGRITLIDISKRIIDGAIGDDVTIRTNRLSAAQSFTDKLDTDAEKAGYSGSGAEDAARSWITTVTKDAATVTAAVATADATISSLLPQSFNLTTSADTFTGSAGNDTFAGSVASLVSQATLNITDKLDGGSGTDRLSLTQAVDFGGFSTGFVKNIENIAITNAGTGALSFDATGVSGAKDFSLTATTGNFTLKNIPTGTNSLTLSGFKASGGASGTVATSFLSGAAEESGTADSLALNLNGVGNPTTVISGTTTTRQTPLNLASYETVNAAVTGDNFVSFVTSNDVKTLNASGAGNLTVVTTNAAVTTVNASALTGNLTFTADATTALKSLSSGSGNDTLNITESKLTGNATISAGSGTDVVNLVSDGGSVEYVMSGVETLNFTDVNTAGLTLSGAKTTDLKTVTTENQTARIVTLTGYGATDLTFVSLGTVLADGTTARTTVDASGDTAADVISDHTGKTVLNYTPSSRIVSTKGQESPLADYSFSGTSDLTVNVGAYVDATASLITAAKATAATLNIASGKSTTDAEQTKYGGTLTTAVATSVKVNAEGSMNTLIIDAAKATSVTIVNGGSDAGTVTLNTPELRTLDITSGNAMTLATGSTAKIQTLNVAVNKGTFTATANDLGAVASATLSGTGTSTGFQSTVALGTVGKKGAAGTGNAYDLSVTATGLKGGLTIADMQVGDGYSINANVKGVTGNVVLNANADLGGNSAGSNVKNLTIDATGIGGALSVAAVAGKSIKASGDLTILAAGAQDASVGVTTVGVFGSGITAKNINIDVSGTTDISQVADTYGLGGTMTLKTHALAVSQDYKITANASTTSMAVDMTGGINVETVTITGISGVTSISFKGNLGSGTDVVVVDNTQNATASTITIADLSSYDGATIRSGAGADTITGGAGKDTIVAGAGANVITGGAGADKFVISGGTSTSTSFTTINDFTASQGDQLVFGSANISVANNGAADSTDTYNPGDGTTTTTVTGKGVATFSGTATLYDTLPEIQAILSDWVTDKGAGTQGTAIFFRLASDTTASYAFIEGGALTDSIVRLVGVPLPSSSTTISTAANGADPSGLSGFGA